MSPAELCKSLRRHEESVTAAPIAIPVLLLYVIAFVLPCKLHRHARTKLILVAFICSPTDTSSTLITAHLQILVLRPGKLLPNPQMRAPVLGVAAF